MDTPAFSNWSAINNATRSRFFSGNCEATKHDRSRGKALFPSEEALFTQSNARVLLGQACNGSLRMLALPTQVYPAPTGIGEFGLGPGMYHHFDVAMYMGDLSYRIQLDDGSQPIDLADLSRTNTTYYADHWLPVTQTVEGDLDITLLSFAPVVQDASTAPLTPAPLPGPAGALYVMVLKNNGTTNRNAKVSLQASDLLVGHYEDAIPEPQDRTHPAVHTRQQTLILSRPEGAVGIHLRDGKWTKSSAPFEAECSVHLAPGAVETVVTYVGAASDPMGIMPVIYELYCHDPLTWLNKTAAYWQSRLGGLHVSADDGSDDAEICRDIYIRSLFDNFNCLQADAQGNVIAHWQGAPSHGYGTVWGIDVEPTAVSVAQLCPEMARQTLLFFMNRSRAPRGTPDHSVPILVAPVIIARKWLEATGDTGFLHAHPKVLAALQSIMDDLQKLRNSSTCLFPSLYSSDGVVGRRYDYGTNAKCVFTFDSFAYLLRSLGRDDEAGRYQTIAADIRSAIAETMVMDGPFGKQISGGTNLGEAPGKIYLPEGVPYYDGEDTSSMLAPIYSACEYTDDAWINYHRFARSIWSAHYDPEFQVLCWSPSENAVFDGTAYFSRLGGCVTKAEMREAMRVLRSTGLDDVTGSVFWWPHGIEYRRSLTRCSQGQGTWAWQYQQQWLGIHADALHHELTIAPRGLNTDIRWMGYRCGDSRFDIVWHEGTDSTTAEVTNHTSELWNLRLGFRSPGCGADGEIHWQTRVLAPAATTRVSYSSAPGKCAMEMTQGEIIRKEVAQFGNADGVIFRRYGAALVWGHWDNTKLWVSGEMPLTLRFDVVNGTNHDWSSALVELHCPAGWKAQGRRRHHWDKPDAMAEGTVRLDVGELPSGNRTTAAFWITGAKPYDIGPSWQDSPTTFHAPTQPGVGITIHARNVEKDQEYLFTAVLRATQSNGAEVTYELLIPYKVSAA